MTENHTIFDATQTYRPDDPLILDLLGDTRKQAQMRHYRKIPYYRLGRSVRYHGADLIRWMSAQRIE